VTAVGITPSDLEAIRKVVEDVVAPLAERVEHIEQKLERPGAPDGERS